MEGGRGKGREWEKGRGREAEEGREGEREGVRRRKVGGSGKEKGRWEGETGNSHLVTDPLHSYLLVFSELLLKANVQVLQFALQWKNHWTSHDAASSYVHSECPLETTLQASST